MYWRTFKVTSRTNVKPASNELQITVAELVHRILMLMKSDLKPDIRAEANNEIKHQYLSAAKARKALGWKPHFDLDPSCLRGGRWPRHSRVVRVGQNGV